jgi:hypothetical protein
MEKLGVEPRTFSTQHVHYCTMLRRCHTARPYPLCRINRLTDEAYHRFNNINQTLQTASRNANVEGPSILEVCRSQVETGTDQSKSKHQGMPIYAVPIQLPTRTSPGEFRSPWYIAELTL